MNLCKTCRFWLADSGEPHPALHQWGECQALSEDERTFQGSEYVELPDEGVRRRALRTRHDFGCVLHEVNMGEGANDATQD